MGMIVGLIAGICFGVSITLACQGWRILSKRRNLRRGDHEMFQTNRVSSNSEDTSGVIILFPNDAEGIKQLTITDILTATEDFSPANIIGCGRFGMVYKATLENGTKLAVKKLPRHKGFVTKEFEAELKVLSTVQHKNLASLNGYYVDNGCQLLLYSYVENGSLEYWLHEKTDGPSELNWPTRLKIAQGASRGLAYLHHVCKPRIVHRDIKSSNIMLDDEFEAYVADFGFSRLIQSFKSHVSTELVGTYGYLPPEYKDSGIASLTGDVYSFGVVLLELLTGKRPMEFFGLDEESRELVMWVKKLRKKGKQDEVFDPFLRGKGSEVEMLKVLDLACMCVIEHPALRPSCNEVADRLLNLTSTHPVEANNS